MELNIIINECPKVLVEIFKNGEGTHSYMMPKNQLGSLLQIIEYELEKNGCNYIHRNHDSHFNQARLNFSK